MTSPELSSDLFYGPDREIQWFDPSDEVVALEGDLHAWQQDDGCCRLNLSRRSEFICCLAWKAKAQDPLGIRFTSYGDESFRIARIDKSSLFAESPLLTGDHVVSINDIGCSGNGYRDAIRQLGHHTGAVTILVHNIGGNSSFHTTYIAKPASMASIGIKVRNVKGGGLEIADLGCIAVETLLKPNDRILSINGIDCKYMSSVDVSEILCNHRRWVTLETISMTQRSCIDQQLQNTQSRSSLPERTEFINALAWKPTCEALLGIRFQFDDGSLVIAKVHADGLFSESALGVGDEVISINDIVCYGNGHKTALRKAYGASGPVSIFAKKTSGTSGMVTTSIIKPSPSTKVGISFKNTDGKLCAGICKAQVLTPGDRIVSINGDHCSLMSASEAAALVRSTPKVVTIVSKKIPESAISSIVQVPAVLVPKERRRNPHQEISFYGGLPHARSVREINKALNSTPDEWCSSPQEESLHIEDCPSLLASATAWKPCPETPLGLKFKSFSDGSFRISGIEPCGIFADSPFRVDDNVVSINDISCSGRGYREALDLARLISGAVTIIGRSDNGDSRFVAVSIHKPSQSTPVGIGFKETNGRLSIGLSTVPLLNVGNLVHTINGIDCRLMRASDAAEMIRNTFQVVTIKAETVSTSPTTQSVTPSVEAMPEVVESFDAEKDDVPCAEAILAMDEVWSEASIPSSPGAPLSCGRAEFISATVWKPTKQTPLGVRFQSYKDGSFQISALEPSGLLANSALCVGDIVVSIDQVSCHGKGYKEALSLLRATSGAVTIVVRSENGDPTIVTSSVSKPVPSTPLGLRFQKVDNRLSLSSVQTSGICGGSLLTSGQKIVLINGVDCRYLDCKDAATMVKHIPGVVTIVSEVLADSGIVVAAS